MPIIVEADAYTGAELERMVDEDIDTFSAYFQSLGNDPLTRFERSTIKTYLAYKLGVTHEQPGFSAQAPTTEEENA